MTQIPEHLIERIRESVDIVDLISRYVSLKKKGKNFGALCPFHTEKTPSFSVSPEKQIFYCFGCGEGGNVFSFLMKFEKISFIEAVKKLAEEVGIQLPQYKQSDSELTEHDRLFRANQFASEFYYNYLKNNYSQISDYISSRKIKKETLDFFRIGLIPDEWSLLHDEIIKQKLSMEPFLRAGLILESEKDKSKKYDRFRNRLIFPIHNLSGRVVAIGGRTLSDDPNIPKYLNSPESPVYNKSQILYGLHFAKDWIRKEELAIFVEGYMDFLQLFQNDIKNAVATSGTALTLDHTRIIRRYTKEIILCYDSDNAGINAALRGGQTLFENNLNVKVLILPEAEDPDSYVRKNGKSAFYSIIQSAKDYFDFKMEYLQSSLANNAIQGQSQVVEELIQSIAAHQDPIKQNFYANILAQRFNLQENTIFSAIKDKIKKLKPRERMISVSEEIDKPSSSKIIAFRGAWSAEKDILIILLNYISDVKKVVFELLEDSDFLNEEFRNIFLMIKKNQHQNSEDLMHHIIVNTEDNNIRNMITREFFTDIKNPISYLNDCIKQVKITRYQSEVNSLRQELSQMNGDNPKFKDILNDINNNLAKIQEIRKIFNNK